MRLRGSIEADIEWREPELACTGMPRPDGRGLRAALFGPAARRRRTRHRFRGAGSRRRRLGARRARQRHAARREPASGSTARRATAAASSTRSSSSRSRTTPSPRAAIRVSATRILHRAGARPGWRWRGAPDALRLHRARDRFARMRSPRHLRRSRYDDGSSTSFSRRLRSLPPALGKRPPLCSPISSRRRSGVITSQRTT